MPIQTDAELTVLALEIRDEVQPSGNTRLRVYTILKNIIDSKPNQDLKPLVIRSGYDVSVTNAFPVSGGTGPASEVYAGNIFPVIGTPGTIDLGLGPEQIPIGSLLLATADVPGQDPTKWRLI